ncbi:MAG: histidine kinase [Verrucomicrobiota bacterium]
MTVSEREKQLISQELHDGLCQNLAGTAMVASMLHHRLATEENPNAEYAKQISGMLSSNVNETRNLAHGLHPVGPEGEGLMNALAQLVETVSNLFHIRCFFRCPEPVLLENEVASTHFFRIAQEAINNARKHGEATRILIDLQNTPEGIMLAIRGNGVGIPLELPKKHGLGRRGMDYRAAEIGATLSVSRVGKRGAVVTCIYRPPEFSPGESGEGSKNATRSSAPAPENDSP